MLAGETQRLDERSSTALGCWLSVAWRMAGSASNDYATSSTRRRGWLTRNRGPGGFGFLGAGVFQPGPVILGSVYKSLPLGMTALMSLRVPGLLEAVEFGFGDACRLALTTVVNLFGTEGKQVARLPPVQWRSPLLVLGCLRKREQWLALTQYGTISKPIQ